MMKAMSLWCAHVVGEGRRDAYVEWVCNAEANYPVHPAPLRPFRRGPDCARPFRRATFRWA